jgi:hypothetical protein
MEKFFALSLLVACPAKIKNWILIPIFSLPIIYALRQQPHHHCSLAFSSATRSNHFKIHLDQFCPQRCYCSSFPPSHSRLVIQAFPYRVSDIILTSWTRKRNPTEQVIWCLSTWQSLIAEYSHPYFSCLCTSSIVCVLWSYRFHLAIRGWYCSASRAGLTTQAVWQVSVSEHAEAVPRLCIASGRLCEAVSGLSFCLLKNHCWNAYSGYSCDESCWSWEN